VALIFWFLVKKSIFDSANKLRNAINLLAMNSLMMSLFPTYVFSLAVCHELGLTVREDGGDNELRAGNSQFATPKWLLICCAIGDSLMSATQLDSQFASAFLGSVLIAYTTCWRLERRTARERDRDTNG